MASSLSQVRQSKSPSPPPWSPISPSAPTTAPMEGMEDLSANLPPNIPISESTNTDVIALRAALAVLQRQRLLSVRNIQTLGKQRDLALANPEEFRQGLANGTIHSQREAETIFEEEDSQDDQDHKPGKIDAKAPPPPLKDFGEMPTALHVVRCPPVNWAKYHVVGEVLDQLHEQQRRLPEPGQMSQSLPARPHAIAAPYSPWHDKLAERTENRIDSSPS